MNKKQINTARVFIAAVTVGVTAIQYMAVTQVERRKRKKIKEWEAENLACIQASHKRLMDVVEGPNFTWQQLANACREEGEFLDIIRNQPMY